VNLFDVGAVLLVSVAAVLGYRSGAIPQLGGLGGAITGAALALLVLPALLPLIDPLEPQWRAFAVLAGILLVVGAGEAVGSTIGRAVQVSLGRGFLGSVDRVGGTFVGVAQGLLIVWLAGGLLANGPLPRLAAQAQASVAVRALATVLPPPTAIAADLGRVLDASGLPDVFVGLEPLPAPPVDPPTDPQVAAIAAAAEDATVRVVARPCSVQSNGSGFIGRPDYVVTNAHVVAGASTVRLNTGDRTVDATIVHFDPELDLAVLWAPDLDGDGLRFATSDPVRGAVGAALGYPGGGGFVALPASVTGSYDAQGRDIYGELRVTRRILELRSAIERGDSGGPLVLADGSVGGVIFAESRTDDDVGYALAASDVAVAVQPAFGRTSSVLPGPCLD
jgi:S1-C subfamily serine protease